ncbi:MAG TPA: hypothetical protein D7H76_01525 [Candidatus Poseidoniales archaeon]|nr:MAG TPA: hypothetical protein D7H76_01525 [Candidatus Poseidoniales archaeon]HII52433.1 hypothetical protein [Candidatus Thalassarchaeaceae archaeon]
MNEEDGMDENIRIPGTDQPVGERILFIHENMVSFVKQYSMPVVEVALVLSKYIRIISLELKNIAESANEELPEHLLKPMSLEDDMQAPLIDSFPLDRLLGSLDEDRMDILDTLMRTAINSVEAPFASVLALLRDWERLVRTQLSTSRSPGHLFSPIELPETF